MLADSTNNCDAFMTMNGHQHFDKTIVAKSMSTNQNSFGAKTDSCCIAGIMAPSSINIQFVCNFAKTMSDSFSVPLRSKTALW